MGRQHGRLRSRGGETDRGKTTIEDGVDVWAAAREAMEKLFGMETAEINITINDVHVASEPNPWVGLLACALGLTCTALHCSAWTQTGTDRTTQRAAVMIDDALLGFTIARSVAARY